ncbi:MAG: hypothetical protein HFH94_15775 [Lachnospiraceae bacterium]|nr:hypothetical protein [Lachnospiraceae bacterium]
MGFGQGSLSYAGLSGEQSKGREADLSVKEERREAGGFYQPCQGMGGQK